MTSKDGLTGRKSKFEDLLTRELTAAEILVLANGDIGLISQAMGFLAGAGKTSQVAALIAAGADVNMFDGFAIHLAASKGHLEVVRLLLRNGARVTPLALEDAAKNHHSDVLSELQKAKAKRRR
jgi:ankyrin repeat protein